MGEQKDKRLFVSAAILIVVHLSGIIGIHSSYKELFLLCTPFNLLLSIGLLFWNHNDFQKPFLIFSAIAFFSGFLIEVMGVKTGVIFGDYSYGNTLGWKLFDVPVIIGVNWLLLVYCVGSIFSKIRKSDLTKAFLGAALLTGMDLFIEVVAIKYDFWEWRGLYPPIRNFFAWYFVSFFLLLAFYHFPFQKENKLAKVLFGVQLIFFIVLAFS